VIIPFNLTGLYLVLLSPAGSYEIWPAFSDVPPDWKVSLGAAPHAACVEHIRQLYAGEGLPTAA